MLLNNNHLLWTIFLEAAVLALFLLYLHWRGWKPSDFHLRISLVSSAQGVALLAVAYLGAVLTLSAMFGLAYALEGAHTFVPFLLKISPHIPPHSIHVSWRSSSSPWSSTPFSRR